jgi:hypothetical protein
VYREWGLTLMHPLRDTLKTRFCMDSHCQSQEQLFGRGVHGRVCRIYVQATSETASVLGQAKHSKAPASP